MVLVAQIPPAVPSRLDGFNHCAVKMGWGCLAVCGVWDVTRLALPSLTSSSLEYLIAARDGEERYLSML